VTHVEQVAAIPAAPDGAGMARPMPVLVLVGGAKGVDEQALETLAAVLRDVVVPCVERHGAAAVDGGTDSGVMRMLGRARAGSGFALVGVAAAGTVRVPGGGPVIDDAADLEPHHTHLVLVPGDTWGDESRWLADVADELNALERFMAERVKAERLRSACFRFLSRTGRYAPATPPRPP